jgi:CheY-like chemotaxis protein
VAQTDMYCLVVAAAPVLRKVLVDFLVPLELKRLETVDSAAAAMNRFNCPDPPNVAIVQMDMPRDGAFDLLRGVRWHADPRVSVLPIIGLRAQWSVEALHAARDAGLTEPVPLPLTTRTLLRNIRKCLTAARPFMASVDYRGPDRRQGDGSGYRGEMRRASDPKKAEKEIVLPPPLSRTEFDVPPEGTKDWQPEFVGVKAAVSEAGRGHVATVCIAADLPSLAPAISSLRTAEKRVVSQAALWELIRKG